MPAISFANAKGGAGKTTAALLLANELAARGETVTIFDADPQRWISHWAALPGKSPRITVINQFTPATIGNAILEERKKVDYVIVDLEGTENLLVANALCVSDLVLVPIQGCAMDAKGGAKVLDLVAKLEKAVRRKIERSVVLTRCHAAVTTRAMKAIQTHLADNGIDVLAQPIIERAVFRDLFDLGGSLRDMDQKKSSNLNKAIENAMSFADEVLTRVPQMKKKSILRFLKRAA